MSIPPASAGTASAIATRAIAETATKVRMLRTPFLVGFKALVMN
jgi:hypothetical protein